ncbi:uncharacterized protein LOC130804788, partial [Amaranthus tricolor]|uniref:uncharacterized protein LOC130804786 n=1 Tax=Amaranthus tricolor TaxID=29722 RepID=UPI0025853BB4
MAGTIAKQQAGVDVETYGPFGNQSGVKWSLVLDPNEYITQIILKTGALVDSIVFATTKPTAFGPVTNRRKFGGDGGPNEFKIELKDGEYITRISGAIGTWNSNREVAKLKIYTNLQPDGYGPYGGTQATKDLSEFSSTIPSGGRVLGFFGTLNNYLQSIGVYGNKKIVQYGPYGNQLKGQQFSTKIDGNEVIKEVIIRHGKCINAIGLVSASALSAFGGTLINNESKIMLKSEEYITKISGTSGEYTYAGHDRVISTLKIYTNFNPKGYGPFGTGQATKNVQS